MVAVEPSVRSSSRAERDPRREGYGEQRERTDADRGRLTERVRFIAGANAGNGAVLCARRHCNEQCGHAQNTLFAGEHA
jgi:hypothetical protein